MVDHDADQWREEIPQIQDWSNKVGTDKAPGRLLADISRSLPSRPVEITPDAAKVVVTCGSSRFTAMLMTELDGLKARPGDRG